MREEHTSINLFRQLVVEESMLLSYEVTRDLPIETREINTPL